MKLRSLLCTFALLPMALPHAVHAQTLQRNFSVTAKTEIPSETLYPGIYSIRVVDHLSDRTVLKVENTSGGKAVTFLAVNGSALPGGDGPVLWAQGTSGRKAMRGFRFPSGEAFEFVYFKSQAVDLAKSNGEKVVAIDPVSEGRPPKDLSGDDLQLVSLWMLSPVRVGPDEGIKAQKYQELARAETQPDLLGGSAPAASTKQPAPAGAAAAAPPARTPRPRTRPVVTRLPKTGSPLPAIALLGLCSLAGAGLLRFSRS